jgi:energy-coupling factor transporter ATP-binding protein EcfA2
MAMQPLKKKEPKKFNISDFKSKLGFQQTQETSNADKPMEWLVMPDAYSAALRLPGIPENYVTTVVGHSNVGKSTLVNHALVAAQRKGRIPVIYDTENNFDFTYARDMGFEAEPVYGDVEIEVVDPETGEITIVTERRIVSYEGNFIYFNNAILAERYGKMDYATGKEVAKGRKVAVIEDIAASINELLNLQDEGEADAGFLFVWDSVGSIASFKSYKSSANNAMWDAAAISVAFNTIVNDRIPRSRKVSSKYDNTLLLINKVWLDSMTNPVGPPSLSLKGGNSMYYASRLIILLGGQLKASTKKLTAQSKGLTYNYGIQTKIKVMKNQLPNPFTVTYEGEVICTPHGMIGVEKSDVETYRKQYVGDILKSLQDMNTKNDIVISETDITFSEEEESDI